MRTDTTCYKKAIQKLKQHHWKSEAKEEHHLSPGVSSDKRKLRSQPTKMKLYVGAIIESDARFIGVQLKSAAKLSTMIGLITKTVTLSLDYTQYVCNTLLIFQIDEKNQSYL